MIEPSQAGLAALGRIYGGAVKDLRAMLRGTDFQRGKAAVLLRQVDGISRRMGEAADGWVSRYTRDLYKKAAARTDLELEKVVGSARLGAEGLQARGTFLEINERAVGVFARTMAHDLAGANLDQADRARRVIRATSQAVLAGPEVSEIVGRGLVSGGNLRNISRGLQARLSEAGKDLLASGRMTATQLKDLVDLDAGLIRAGSRMMDIRYYATMVADTQLREAATAATVEQLEAWSQEAGDPLAFDLVIVTGPHGACEVCEEYVDNVYSISGRHPDHPLLPDGGPPFHPNCTHNIAPYVEGF